MPDFERHVFVCGNQREPGHPRGCCAEKDAAAVRSALKAAIKQQGLGGRVRANEAGCLDQCEHGVTIVVYPEQVWYGFVRAEDVAEIVEQHLVHGRPVDRLRLATTCVNVKACPHRVPTTPAGAPSSVAASNTVARAAAPPDAGTGG
ncbi:MAG: ferredoxin [Phycisphaerae bacterium]